MAKTNNTRQAAWVAVGSLCSFGFAIVSSAILSRYFNKADYGTYKQVMYVYTTLLTVFTLGLPKAFSYFLPRVDICQAKSLIRKITNLFFILGGAFSLLLFIASPLISELLKNPDLKTALRYFAIVPFFLLPTMGLEGILATFRKTKFIAVYNVITNTFKLLCVAVPVMVWDLGYIEAIIGFVISSFLIFLLAIYLKYLPVRNQPNEKCTVSYRDIFQFSIPLLTASLWGIIISSADQFFISRYYGSEVFAEFSNGAIPLPFVGMITGACATVLSPIFSKMSHEKVDPMKDVFPLWTSVFKKSAQLIYPLLLYCIIFADVLMVALYGKQYECSAVYFRIKNLIYFLDIIVFAPLVINIGHVKSYSRAHMIVAIVVVSLEAACVRLVDSPIAISIVSLVCQVLKILLLLSVVARYFGTRITRLFPWMYVLKIILPSLVILLLGHFLFTAYFKMNEWLALFVGFAFYCALFIPYSFAAKLDYVSVVKPFLVDSHKSR